MERQNSLPVGIERATEQPASCYGTTEQPDLIILAARVALFDQSKIEFIGR